MTETPNKTALVITYGPVPTPEHQTVEGGGMRAWGLATGLASQGIDVTVGVNNSFPQTLKEHENINLTNWGLDESFIELMNSFDSVIVSYCMGDPSVFIADNLNSGIQLILDVYVPIYVEVSARESKDIDTEYKNYMADIARHNKVLRRGDYFLCASESQKELYTGVLSALGIINPHSYRTERIIIAPFGIHDIKPSASHNPYLDLGIKNDEHVVLWFGGLYPWFRIQELLDALLELSKHPKIKFVFVGGKNPFNPNPDFFRQYDKAVDFAKKNGLLDKSVYFVDWVNFDDRVNWFVHADTVISLNQPGEENIYSWRTRVMDFVWGNLAIITNGGDPLSEQLLERNAAIRLPELSSSHITKAVLELFKNTASLAKVRDNIRHIRPDYFWQNITKPIAQIIESGELPYSDELSFQAKFGLEGVNEQPTASASASSNNSKLKGLAAKVRRTAKYARTKGVRQSLKLGKNIILTQIRSLPNDGPRRFVFISHPINDTGAPLVLLDIIEEYAKKYGGKRVLVAAPDILKHHQKRLDKLGVQTTKAAFGLDFRFIRLQLGLRKNDFVLMNTIAIYDNYRDFILLWLRLGRLKQAYWFVHEDMEQIPIINKPFLDKKNLQHIKEAAETSSLKLLFPSKRTAKEYEGLLNIKTSHVIRLRIHVEKKLQSPRSERDFNTIRILLSGTPADGRKGQILALNALQYYINTYLSKNQRAYRPVELHLVAIDKDNYISKQIRWISKSLLPSYVFLYDSLPKHQAMDVTHKCNTVICVSLNETFGLYIAEGMLMGHVLLRNNCAGVDEQLQDGVNGYLIDHTNVVDIAKHIEIIANKNKTKNSDLLKMSKASQRLITEYQQYTYQKQIES